MNEQDQTTDGLSNEEQNQKIRDANQNFEKRFNELQSRARQVGLDLELNHEKTISTSLSNGLEVRVADFRRFSGAEGRFIVSFTGDEVSCVRESSGTSSRRTKENEFGRMFDESAVINHYFLEFLKEKIERKEKTQRREESRKDYKLEQTLDNIVPDVYSQEVEDDQEDVCPVCEGDCEVAEEESSGETKYVKCPECNGTGFKGGEE